MVAATHGYPRLFNGLENRYGEGPDFEVMATGQAVRVDDLECCSGCIAYGAAADCRDADWSLMAFKLSALGQCWVCYTSMPMIPSFDSSVGRDRCSVCHACGIGVDNARREQHFPSALNSRDAIGQAKGHDHGAVPRRCRCGLRDADQDVAEFEYADRGHRAGVDHYGSDSTLSAGYRF